MGEDGDYFGAAKAGVSFLLQGPPGSGKSHRAREIVEAVAPLRKVYVISFTNCAVATMRGGPAQYMTVDRFITRVLHRNLLVTPCLVLWDEVFFVSTNMLARTSKLQGHRDVQIVCCGDPRQLRAPQDSWKGVPASKTLEGSQMLASLCPTHVHLTTRSASPTPFDRRSL